MSDQEIESVHRTYLDIGTSLRRDREKLVRPETDDIYSSFRQFEACYPVVLRHNAHREAVIDSNLLNEYGSLIHIRSQKCSDRIRFQKRNRFLRSAKQLFDKFGMSAFDDILGQCGKSTVHVRCLLPFLPQHSVTESDQAGSGRGIKRSRRVVEKQLAEAKCPIPITSDTAESSLQKLSSLSNEMYAELSSRGHRGMTVGQFTSNPHSFSGTVERMFNFSVLLKESLISLQGRDEQRTIDKSRCLVRVAEETDSEEDSQVEFCHLPFTISMDEWKSSSQ